MRKKLTLTIDADVYDMIKDLPRKISISEVVSFILKAMYQDLKKGRELTQEEFEVWAKSSPELADIRERMREHWGSGIRKIDEVVEKVKTIAKPRKSKKDK
ncbi:MAG: hypothetical protein ACLQF0_07705 [Dissulfurispiraceae bacterium]